ncbi:MAG: SGNH/GDSL hydrolase family protein [Elusimicrobia bacterium]|nr:SGNH/GDSL hydrolase family protein [Elusimicrobiota bacterium]
MKKRRPANADVQDSRPGFRVLRSLAAVLLVLAAIEGLARWRFRKNLDSLKFTESDLYYYYDPSGHRHNLPGKKGYERLWNDQGRAEFRINSHGFRGPELGPKLESDFRILFLGDSITLGGRLPEDATYAAHVGRALAPISRRRFEVINAGVGDVGLVEEEETLKTEGLAVKPELVVLFWYLNDARPPVGFPEEKVYADPFIRWLHDRTWLRRSYAAGAVYQARRSALVSRGLESLQTRRFEWIDAYLKNKWYTDADEFSKLIELARFDWGDGWRDESLRWTATKVSELSALAKRRGARFAVVLLPLHAQVYAEFKAPLLDKPQRELGAALTAAGIPHLDLLPRLRSAARAKPEARLFFDHCHYTPEGNAAVGRLVLEFLQTKGLL